MSDDYRDGCSKRWTLAWFLAMPLLALAWLADVTRKDGRR